MNQKAQMAMSNLHLTESLKNIRQSLCVNVAALIIKNAYASQGEGFLPTALERQLPNEDEVLKVSNAIEHATDNLNKEELQHLLIDLVTNVLNPGQMVSRILVGCT